MMRKCKYDLLVESMTLVKSLTEQWPGCLDEFHRGRLKRCQNIVLGAWLKGPLEAHGPFPQCLFPAYEFSIAFSSTSPIP